MSVLTLRDAAAGPAGRVDVRVVDGVVTRIGAHLGPADGERLDCAGAAVLPGLHDHHVHLLATAAAVESVVCGPPRVSGLADLASALNEATPVNGWIRGVGYDDGIGPLDRAVLDGLRSDVPVRVQHRGGSLWVLNSAAVTALRLDDADLVGIERDAAGCPTGRLWRLDDWLRDRLGCAAKPDLTALSVRLAAHGITGVTDATPNLSADAVQLLTSGRLAQRVTLLGDPAGRAPWKIVVSDHELPGLDELRSHIAAVRPRPVALHCVTRAALVLTLTALREVGVRRGDRIEHAAVCPPDVAVQLAELGVAVVTQPSLIARRGDDYLDRVDAEDATALWPFASLLAAGVAVGCSSDAPYGDVNPWQAIAAAADRRTPSGRILGAAERVPAQTALKRFLTVPQDPGGAARAVRAGAVADLIVLDRPLADALQDPNEVRVRHTIIGGRIVHSLEGAPA